MQATRRARLRAAPLAAALLLAAASGAAAQRPARAVPPVQARDTVPVAPATAPRVAVPGDTVPGDTLPGDSLPPPPPTDAATDSVLRALRALPGYTATEYQGETAVYRAEEGVLRLQGTAGVERAGDRLTADTILYLSRSDSVIAIGSPKVAGQAQELEGEVLYYDLARRRATALGARTTVAQQATWYVAGDLTLEGSERLYGSHGRFTTCDLEIPHYHFESDQIKIIRDRYLVARPARLYFGNVPVMVLPFVVQSLERGRRSGLVVPEFRLNDVVRTNSDYTREISNLGWYWAINDYLGAQLTGTWRSESYTGLNGSLEWNWRRQFLNGRATVQRYWRETGNRELAYDVSSGWKPDERTDLRVQGRYASSSRFVRDASYDPRETTQELLSTLSTTRRFDWGKVAFGATRRQSIADGTVSGTLPELSISPNPITLFRAPAGGQARWYNNSTLQVNFDGRRTFESGDTTASTLEELGGESELRLNGTQSLSIGNLQLSTNASWNQTLLEEVVGTDSVPGFLPERVEGTGRWSASIGYQQRLIGQTTLTPSLNIGQDLLRTDGTGDPWVRPDGPAWLPEGYHRGPLRSSLGVSLRSALFGFYPGVGPFSAIRHRISPAINYSYSPRTELTAQQREVFGDRESRAQNRISLQFSQTWEAKLRPREADRDEDAEVEVPASVDTAAADPAAIDTAAAGSPGAARAGAGGAQEPEEARKVTLLSLNTSAFQYDFVQAAEEGTGWVTTRVNNTVTSDYLQGLTISMAHDLFDRRGVEPTDRGDIGRFAPQLSSLSTSFELGPTSGVVRWLTALLGDPTAEENPATEGVMPGEDQPVDVAPPGSGAATGSPQGTGAGPWRVGVGYSFTRPQRTPRALDNDAVQTVRLDTNFALTPNWAVSWNTEYSTTDRQFSFHRLNFRRDLHRWQANFSYFKTPNGNGAFEFRVELIDNREIQLDYNERNLGIDRRR